MDVPSTSSIRPTTSNKRLCQRHVDVDLIETHEAKDAMDAEEVVQEHLEAQEQPKVHEQQEVYHRTSIVV